MWPRWNANASAASDLGDYSDDDKHVDGDDNHYDHVVRVCVLFFTLPWSPFI